MRTVQSARKSQADGSDPARICRVAAGHGVPGARAGRVARRGVCGARRAERKNSRDHWPSARTWDAAGSMPAYAGARRSESESFRAEEDGRGPHLLQRQATRGRRSTELVCTTKDPARRKVAPASVAQCSMLNAQCSMLGAQCSMRPSRRPGAAFRATLLRPRKPDQYNESEEQQARYIKDVIGRLHEGLLIHQAIHERIALIGIQAAGMEIGARLRRDGITISQMLDELRVMQRCPPIPQGRRNRRTE